MKYHYFQDLIPRGYSETILRKFGENMPWYYTDSASGVYENYDFDDPKIKDSVQFVHPIADDNIGRSELFSLVLPIVWFLEKASGLELVNVLRIKANCLTRDGEGDFYNPPHIDVTESGYYSLIYYVNDSDGDTVLFNEFYDHGHAGLTEMTRITPRQGSALLIPSHLFHSSSCPIKTRNRLVINMILELR
jgi:hypothetical protein